MKISTKKATIQGCLKAPSSKSSLIRHLALATLAKGTTTLHNVDFCNDTVAALNICKNLGAKVEFGDGFLTITPNYYPIKNLLNCGESALCARVFAPISAVFDQDFTLVGEGSLLSRPMEMVANALRQMGTNCQLNSGFLPIKTSGTISNFYLKLDGSTTSQLLSGLLITLPKTGKTSTIQVENPQSIPYIKLTLQIMRQYGVEVKNFKFKRFEIEPPQNYIGGSFEVEGDYSGAAFFLVIGALHGKVKVKNLLQDSYQADKQIIEILKKCGAYVEVGEDWVVAEKRVLKPFVFDANHCPDLFPPLVALASKIEGKSEILGAKRLLTKESNRATTLQKEFKKLEVRIDIENDKMVIFGNKKPRVAKVKSHNDHRIAMALATSCLSKGDEIEIEKTRCVNKSYPKFFQDLKGLI